MRVLAQLSRLSITVLSVITLVAVTQLSTSTPAYAGGSTGKATWTGAAQDSKFSTAGNWAENAIPEDGDELIFNTASPVAKASSDKDETINNDLNISFSKITISKDQSVSNNDYYYSYYTTGNVVKLQNNASIERTENSNIYLSIMAGLQGSGNLTLKNYNMFNKLNTPGDLTSIDSMGELGGDNGITGISSLTISGNTMYTLDSNITYPITVNNGAAVAFNVYDTCTKYDKAYSCQKWAGKSITISSNLTLAEDVNVYMSGASNVKFTGKISGSGTIKRNPMSSPNASLTVNGKKLVNPVKTTKLTGSKTGISTPGAYVYVYDNETAILSGKREFISVQQGGKLTGTGTVGSLYVSGLGTVSPGNSPGKITVLDDLTLENGAIYQAEILDSKNYDQIVAKNVLISDATLKLSFLKGGKITKGDKFTLINNTGKGPIQGTFKGVKEGDKITLGKAVFVVTYKGGAGKNDFVLTAINDAVAPGTPNTGFHATTLANPLLIATMGVVSIAGLLYLRRVSK